jgi:enterochelin esterase family protein
MKRAILIGCMFLSASPASAQDMQLSQVLIDGETWKAVATNYQAIKSLAADREGNIYVADPVARRFDRITRDGKVAGYGNLKDPVSGVCVAPDGRLFLCQPSRRRIVTLGSQGESAVVENIDAESLVVTREGVIYCTVPRDLAVYRIAPGAKRQRVDDAVVAPSALTLWPDDGTLVIGYPASTYLWACRVEKDGSLSSKDRYYALRTPTGTTASGVAQLTEDDARRLYAATSKGVQIFDPTGRMCGVVLKPDRADVTAVTIGGADHSTLFIGCGTTVYARKIKAKGAFPLTSQGK